MVFFWLVAILRPKKQGKHAGFSNKLCVVSFHAKKGLIKYDYHAENKHPIWKEIKPNQSAATWTKS